jgi:hypothetical protein
VGLTRRPFNPSSTAIAAWPRSYCSAVNRSTPSSGAIQPASVRCVDLGSADVLGGVGPDAPVDVCESVEATDCREPTVDRRRREPAVLHRAAEQLDVRTARLHDDDAVIAGPLEEAAQVVAIRLERATAVTGKERDRS